MTREFYELAQNDVGKHIIKAFGRVWLVQNFIGQVFPSDVGKRVYDCGGFLQVENDEQLQKRIAGMQKKRL